MNKNKTEGYVIAAWVTLMLLIGIITNLGDSDKAVSGGGVTSTGSGKGGTTTSTGTGGNVKSKNGAAGTKQAGNTGKRNSSSKSKSKAQENSYDAGYDDVYDNGDYDYDRYDRDGEYADGVDDALEDYYDEYGEDW